MPTAIVQVDAFTNVPLQGHQAGDSVLAEARDPAWMQLVAREMNLSETAFLVRRGAGYHLRWFTPTVEVELCGHATLASAHVLWEDGHLGRGTRAEFDTLSGKLWATQNGDWIELDFPADSTKPVEASPVLAEGLGVKSFRYTGRDGFDYLCELESEAIVRSLQPDFKLLKQAGPRGIIVTARADSKDFDCVSRFFAPAYGVDEDPVTGSAHGTLGPYWASRLGKNDLVGYQASARGGIVRVGVRGNRVLIGGQAVTVLRGELLD
ncbi:MAG: PhzF family phenazine biosynthesis protein [Acidobacteria bacterium]|nr:MAG: PhzF family phenazine biosynthesis protein [Acidobacteriota bacterium]